MELVSYVSISCLPRLEVSAGLSTALVDAATSQALEITVVPGFTVADAR
jgi:hypothetical protein